MTTQRFILVQGEHITIVEGAAADVVIGRPPAEACPTVHVIIGGLPDTAPRTVARVFAAAAIEDYPGPPITRVLVYYRDDQGQQGCIPVEIVPAGPRELTSTPSPDITGWRQWLQGGGVPGERQLSLSLF